MKLTAPTVLVMCEGFGYSTEIPNNAIAQAETPFLNTLCQRYPTTLLKAHGSALGYPDYYGSSLYGGFWTLVTGNKNTSMIQEFEKDVKNGEFFENPVLDKHLSYLARQNKRLHIIITLSLNAPENRIEHMLALIHTALFYGIKNIPVHLVLSDSTIFDMSTFLLLDKIESALSTTGCAHLASIQGKEYTHFYHETKTQESYNLFAHAVTPTFTRAYDALSHFYVQGICDKNIVPTALISNAAVDPKDGIIFVNYDGFECHALKDYMVEKNIPCHHIFSLFGSTSSYITALYNEKKYENHLATLTKNNALSLLSFIEYTHKNNLYFYAQTHFKNFTQDIAVRCIPPSYHLSSNAISGITEAFLEALRFEEQDIYILNYTTPALHALNDNLTASIQAIEELDKELERIYYHVVEKEGGKLFITSSGPLVENIPPAESSFAFSRNNNPVYFIAVDPYYTHPNHDLPVYELSDVAEFITRDQL